MASPASIGKHPVHPMIIPFPIALWIFFTACGFDLSVAWESSLARLHLVLCVARRHSGSGGCSRPGIYRLAVDQRATGKEARGLACAVNVIALLVFIADFYVRTRSGASWIGTSLTLPLLLSVLGVILIGISGWLAGEVVYVHGVAVEPQPATASEPRSARKDRRAA